MVHAVVLELKHTHIAIGGGAGKKATAFMRSPRDDVNACGVQCKIKDFLPLMCQLMQ